MGSVGSLCEDLGIEVSRGDLGTFEELQNIHDEEWSWQDDGSITEDAKAQFNNLIHEYDPTLVGFELKGKDHE